MPILKRLSVESNDSLVDCSGLPDISSLSYLTLQQNPGLGV